MRLNMNRIFFIEIIAIWYSNIISQHNIFHKLLELVVISPRMSFSVVMATSRNAKVDFEGLRETWKAMISQGMTREMENSRRNRESEVDSLLWSCFSYFFSSFLAQNEHNCTRFCVIDFEWFNEWRWRPPIFSSPPTCEVRNVLSSLFMVRSFARVYSLLCNANDMNRSSRTSQ